MKTTSLRSGLWPYVHIARPDHWFKHVFMIPGVLLVLYAQPALLEMTTFTRVAIAFAAACLIASSYYVLNEILDAPFDARHPVKRERPIPSGLVSIPFAYMEWAGLALLGLGLASLLGKQFFAASLALWIMSLIYNVRPLRAKDRVYLDVLVESVNNPLRLAMGWYATGTDMVIPVSMVMVFWMLGAFFMAMKRFAEYRLIGAERAEAYRVVFRRYNDVRLLVSAVFYAVAFGLFLGIFLIRYRLELLVIVPFVAGMIAWYIHLGFLPESPAQYPERLYRQRGFMAYLVACVCACILALHVDIPVLHTIFAPTETLLGAGRG